MGVRYAEVRVSWLYSMTDQILKDTLIEPPLKRTALPELVVVVFETFPVVGKLLEAMLVQIIDAV